MKIKYKIYVLLCIAFFWFWGIIAEPYLLLTVEKVKICAPNWDMKLDGLKVGLIGDIHARPTKIEEFRVRNAVETLNAQNPDIIFLLGDYLNGGARIAMDEDKLSKILSSLKAPYGVYAILGNHDSYYSRAKIRKMLRKANIRLLENSNVKINTPRGDFYVAAISDPVTSTYSYKSAFKKIPKGAPVIFLTHAATVIKDVPSAASVSFAGHTHGGQIRLPFFGALIAHDSDSRIYSKGLAHYNDKVVYTNVGIGTSRIPVRYFCPPEVTVASLYKGDISKSDIKSLMIKN